VNVFLKLEYHWLVSFVCWHTSAVPVSIRSTDAADSTRRVPVVHSLFTQIHD